MCYSVHGLSKEKLHLDNIRWRKSYSFNSTRCQV